MVWNRNCSDKPRPIARAFHVHEMQNGPLCVEAQGEDATGCLEGLCKCTSI